MHDLGRTAQIADGLEQGHRHDGGGGRALRAVEARLLQQDVHLQQIRNAVAFRDDVALDAFGTVAAMRLGRCADDGELGCGLGSVGGIGTRQQPLGGEFTAQ